jgi:hypothetical protein
MSTTTTRICAALAAAVALLCPAPARAEHGYARPPGEAAPPADDYAVPVDDPPARPDDFYEQESALRVSTGPVLRATSERADGGLGAAVDIGAKAAGVRFSGSWVGVGGDRGLSQYDAQLWLDFGADERLHPIVAAGAGLARLESAVAEGGTRGSTLGVATLRGTLEYVLPIREANARAGLDLEGALPAIRGENSPDVAGWLLVTARVGIGF